MEQLIARCPAQYFWSYNRYKQPQGVARRKPAGGRMRLLLGLMWLLHWLPLPMLGRFGEAIGSLLFMRCRSARHIALTNLRLCMPELSEAERASPSRKRHFQAYSRSVWSAALLWWAPKRACAA
jgi:lauroyl/myristoyl acyltransferase